MTIGILTVIVYAFSWWNEFISDDIAGIALNPSLGNFWKQAATMNINNIVYSIIYVIFGPTPFWFHINNTITHVATIFLVYAVTWLISADKRISRITSLIFALHPLETEGVTWISGYPYTIYTFFSLATVIVFILVDKKIIRHIWIWSTALLFLLALRSSEKAIVVPGILALYLVVFSKVTFRKLFSLIPTAGVAAVYVVFLFFNLFKRIEYINPAYQTGEPIVYNPLEQIPTAIGSYVQLMLLPYNLTLYHEFLVYSPVHFAISIGVTVFVLLAIVFFWKRNPLVSFGLGFFVVSLSPTLLPVNIAWIVAERYVHFGTVGFFIAVSALFTTIVKRFRIPDDRVFMTLAILVIILGGLTIKRNLEWRSQDTFWPVTMKVSPYSAYAHNNMGDYYGRNGDIQNSIASFERARKLRPRYAEATHNLGNVYEAIGEATKAAELFEEAISYNPTQYQSYQKRGKILYMLGDAGKAADMFAKSAAINPDPFDDYISLYVIFGRAGKKDEQQAILRKAYSLASDNQERMMILERVLYENK